MTVWYALRSLSLLMRSSTPWRVYPVILRTRLTVLRDRARLAPRREAFRAMMRERDFSTDWFTRRLDGWLTVFERHPLPASAEVLEIGSWEGMSSLFILATWPDARLTCVDNWQGGGICAGIAAGAGSEARFDVNMADYADRIDKFTGTSAAYFAARDPGERFDFIYVDGSHRYADVLIDAFEGFDALKPGGIMIFDDYLLPSNGGPSDCPAPALNRLLSDRRGRYELLAVSWQLVIRKLPAGVPR